MAYLLGIDIGSTSLKAIIFDTAGNLMACSSRPNTVVYLDPQHPHWASWHPDTLWNDIAAAIHEAVQQITDPVLIQGVAVTGLGMDGLPLDADGNWLYPFISWQCPRTEPISRQWKTDVGAKDTFSIGGKQILPFDTIFRLMWMQEHEPKILGKTETWLLIEDFINFKLCGRKATDYSMASSTLVLDQRTHRWSDELIARAGVDRHLFPEILPSGTLLGGVTATAASMTGLKAGTPVVLGGHDYHCAALAVGAFKPNIVMDITGTWEMVLMASRELYLTDEIFDAGLSIEHHVARDAYAIMGSSVCADMLEWFRTYYGSTTDVPTDTADNRIQWEALMELATNAPCGSHGVFFLPHFFGSSCPVLDSSSLGAFLGLHHTVTKGDMLRAIIEGLNYQFNEMIMAIERPLKTTTDRIIAVGGGTRNRFWMQNKADVTGKTLEVPNIEEATALGAAILAGIGVGIYQDEQDAVDKTYKPCTIYVPNPDAHAKYERYFQIYQQMYPALKDINRNIFQKFRM